MIWAVIWYYLLVVFTAADIITTKIASSYNGLYEGNPIMNPHLGNIVEMKLLLLIIVAICMISLEILSKKYQWIPDSWLPVSLGTTFTSVVVVSNIAKVSTFI